MRAVFVERFGRPEELKLREVPSPHPGPGQVLVEAHAMGVNYPDLMVIAGTYHNLHPLPFVPGKELAGIVRAVGEGVEGLRPGERVAAQLEVGAFAEEVLVPAVQCYPIPPGIPMVVAAAMGLAYLTSYFALTDRARLAPGEWVLVSGAAGGVGIAAVELAKALGGHTIAGLTTMTKAAFVEAHGADAVVDLSAADLMNTLRARVREITHGHGVDVVVDPVGGVVFEASLRTLAWGGRMIVVGFTSGEMPSVRANYILVKHISVTGLHWSDYREREPKRVADAQALLFRLVEEGKLHPPVMETYPFERIAEALAVIAERRVMGKVALLTRHAKEG